MNTIQKSWEEYKEKVVPENAGKTQIDETRKAFYAGVLSFINITCTIADSYSTDEDIDTIYHACVEEVTDFFNSLPQ